MRYFPSCSCCCWGHAAGPGAAECRDRRYRPEHRHQPADVHGTGARAGQLFFYDGLYWLYQGDNWYASSWYSGPWGLVAPAQVPVFILRIPARYYRAPPTYFRDWRLDAPPRWDEHWGRDWAQGRGDWDPSRRSAALSPAPLPNYQRRCTGPRYPQEEQQRVLRDQRRADPPTPTQRHRPGRSAPEGWARPLERARPWGPGTHSGCPAGFARY